MLRTKVILNVTSFFIFILGFTYIALSNYYMGFERDLVYREYVLEQEHLSYVNFIFLAIFWGVFSFFAFQKLLCKYSLYRAFNVFVFIFLCGITILYQFNFIIETMSFVVLNLFGFLRVGILMLEKRGY